LSIKKGQSCYVSLIIMINVFKTHKLYTWIDWVYLG